MKTIKQLADELGVSKTSIRKHLTDEVKTQFAETISGTIYIDKCGENIIKSKFFGVKPETKFSAVSGNQSAEVSALVSMLQTELDIKNEQIKELNSRLAESNAALVTAQQTAQAAQALHAGDIMPRIPSGSSDPANTKPTTAKKGILQRIFSKE